MSAVKYLVPALAIAGRAVAQSSSCSVSGTTTVQNAGDATAIASCTTFSGSIAIATGTTDNIAFDGLREITGALIADNVTQITEISSSTLETIGDAFNLNGLTILSTLSFPQLTDVGSIIWEALPALQGLSFGTDGVQTTSELNIQNTELNSLDGINLQVVDTVYIANNNYLQDISMQLGNITNSLTIESNGRNVSAVFPNLIWANNMTLRNVSSVDFASLESVNGSLGFYSNEFEKLTCANLTSVGGSLSFVSNADLTNISMPLLKTIGGAFQIANNTEFKIVDGFNAVTTVSGAVDFYGNFTNVTLPSLKTVKGAFNLQSSADITSSCDVFNQEHGSSSVIQGKYYCHGTVSHPSSTLGSGSSSSGSSSSSSASASSSSSGAAAGVYIPGAATGFMGVVAVLFGLM